MKLKLLLPTLIVIASQSVFAVASTKPEKCPSVSAIQSTGITDVIPDDQAPGKWIGGVDSTMYDTKETWTFVVSVKASNEVDAKNKMLSDLASLKLIMGPSPVRGNEWGCEYLAKSGDRAGSFTPALGKLALFH